jgi:hypothetical protein
VRCGLWTALVFLASGAEIDYQDQDIDRGEHTALRSLRAGRVPGVQAAEAQVLKRHPGLRPKDPIDESTRAPTGDSRSIDQDSGNSMTLGCGAQPRPRALLRRALQHRDAGRCTTPRLSFPCVAFSGE